MNQEADIQGLLLPIANEEEMDKILDEDDID